MVGEEGAEGLVEGDWGGGGRGGSEGGEGEGRVDQPERSSRRREEADERRMAGRTIRLLTSAATVGAGSGHYFGVVDVVLVAGD